MNWLYNNKIRKAIAHTCILYMYNANHTQNTLLTNFIHTCTLVHGRKALQLVGVSYLTACELLLCIPTSAWIIFVIIIADLSKIILGSLDQM